MQYQIGSSSLAQEIQNNTCRREATPESRNPSRLNIILTTKAASSFTYYVQLRTVVCLLLLLLHCYSSSLPRLQIMTMMHLPKAPDYTSNVLETGVGFRNSPPGLSKLLLLPLPDSFSLYLRSLLCSLLSLCPCLSQFAALESLVFLPAQLIASQVTADVFQSYACFLLGLRTKRFLGECKNTLSLHVMQIGMCMLLYSSRFGSSFLCTTKPGLKC